MGGSSIQNATTIESEDFTGKINMYANDTLNCTTACKITIKGTDVNINDIKKVSFKIDTQPIYVYIVDSASRVLYDIVSSTKNEVVIQTRVRTPYRTSKVLQGGSGTSSQNTGVTRPKLVVKLFT